MFRLILSSVGLMYQILSTCALWSKLLLALLLLHPCCLANLTLREQYLAVSRATFCGDDGDDTTRFSTFSPTLWDDTSRFYNIHCEGCEPADSRWGWAHRYLRVSRQSGIRDPQVWALRKMMVQSIGFWSSLEYPIFRLKCCWRSVLLRAPPVGNTGDKTWEHSSQGHQATGIFSSEATFILV